MNSSMNRNKIISSLFWKLVERAGAQGIQMLVQILLARLLTPKEFGTMAIVLVFINIAQVFIQGGFNVALIQKKDADDLDFSSILYLSLIVAFFLYIIIFLFSPYIATFYGDLMLIPLLRVIGIVLFFGAISSIQLAYMSKKLQFKLSAKSSLLSTVISGIVGIVCASVGLGIWSLVVQQLLYNVINCSYLWIFLDWKPTLNFSLNRVKILFSFGSRILVSSLIYRIYLEIRTLIIGRQFSPSSLGFYQRGEQIPKVLVSNIDGAIQAVILPTLSLHQDKPQKIKQMVRRSLKISSYIVFPMMFGIIAVADNLVLFLLGEAWILTTPYLVIFSLTYSFWPIITINQQTARALGRSDIILKTEVLKRVIGLVIIVISLKFGVLAIAVGFLIERFIETLINSYPNKELIDYNFSEQLKDILPSFVQAISMAILVYLINYIKLNLFLRLIIQIFVGVTAYIVLSITFKNESYEYLKMIVLERKYIKKNNS